MKTTPDITPSKTGNPVSPEPLLQHNNGGVYAIIDTKAEAVIGFLMICKHPAQAVRNFCDVADDQKSMINRHPEDYELVRLGWLTLENHVIPEHALILSGSSYAASKLKTETPNERL